MNIITYNEFNKVDILSGTIIKVEIFERANNKAYKIWADFGFIVGIKRTSAQVTINYNLHELIGMQILGCANLGSKKIPNGKKLC